jgi:predicted PurR-regulated permease PerM
MMTLAIAVVVVAALAFGKDVVIPIILAVLLSFVLAPFVDLLRRLRIGRVPAVIVATVVALGVILGLTGVIGLQVAQLASDLPQYRTTVREKISSLQGGFFSRASEMVKDLGREIDQATESPPAAAPPGAPRPSAAPADKPLVVEVRQPDLSPIELAKRFLLPALEPLATGFITIIVVIFILMQREDCATA